MNKTFLLHLPNLEHAELNYLNEITGGYTEKELEEFVLLYKGKRKDPQTILIVTILGFFVVAGIQRFMLDQVGMGILYLLTAGLCWIGTIIDLVNYKTMTLEYNQRVAAETARMVR